MLRSVSPSEGEHGEPAHKAPTADEGPRRPFSRCSNMRNAGISDGALQSSHEPHRAAGGRALMDETAGGAVLDASAVLAYLRLRVADCRLRREQIRSLKSVIDNRQVVGW